MDAIGTSLGDTQSWPQLTITSDTLRVVGHTAWDIGTTKSEESGGGEHVSHYLVVLRRGLKEWKINSLALVPEAPAAISAVGRSVSGAAVVPRRLEV